MSDRGRVVLIFVIVGLLAGGGGYYFFKIYRPAQDLKNAQSEIAGWEARYQAVRDCLLGTSPKSSKTSEALAIREMMPAEALAMRQRTPGGENKSCTPLISKLSRGEAPDTGVPVIEDAWVLLDKSASKAALAFARHVSESTTLQEDPLPTALDDLDSARLALRAAARMPATESAGTPLPVAQTLQIADGDERLTELLIDTIPSAHGMVLFGESGSHTVQVKLTAGAAPEVRRAAPGTIRSVPDMSWGATATEPALLAGAFDVEGAIAAPTRFEISKPTIAAVSGTLQEGVLVYGNQTDLVIAKAKAGTLTAGAPIKITAAQSGVDVDGRVALIWDEPSGTKGQIMKPGGEEPAVELPPQIGKLCLTADRAWAQTGDIAISFGGGRPTVKRPMYEPEPVMIHGTGPEAVIAAYGPPRLVMLQGCTAEVALFHNQVVPDTLMICGDDCRTVRIPSEAPQFATTTVVGGKLVSIASHGGVLGVWHEGGKVVFYALPETATPVLSHEWPAMALTDGKVIDVIARGAKGFVLIRVPAA